MMGTSLGSPVPKAERRPGAAGRVLKGRLAPAGPAGVSDRKALRVTRGQVGRTRAASAKWRRRPARCFPSAAGCGRSGQPGPSQRRRPCSLPVGSGGCRWTRLSGVLRESAGPGSVLVGGAGQFKDPAPGQGISDALRQPERSGVGRPRWGKGNPVRSTGPRPDSGVGATATRRDAFGRIRPRQDRFHAGDGRRDVPRSAPTRRVASS